MFLEHKNGVAMALMKTITYMNFERGDSTKQKNDLRKMMEDKGCKMIHEVRDDKNRVIEWIFIGAIQYGTFDTSLMDKPIPKKTVFDFDPSGGNE